MQLLIVYSFNVLLVVPAFSEFAQFFQCFCANDCLKNFHLEVLSVFLSPKLSTTDHFTIVKGSIC